MAAVPERFVEIASALTAHLAGREIRPELADELNVELPIDSPLVREVEALCTRGCEDGWLCGRNANGIKYGRVVDPGPRMHGFSVDVVDMAEIAGPHHSHPNGEIDLVMPQEGAATFDGRPAGWTVYGPGSSHSPTVTGGRALILYLLPAGAISFTRA